MYISIQGKREKNSKVKPRQKKKDKYWYKINGRFFSSWSPNPPFFSFFSFLLLFFPFDFHLFIPWCIYVFYGNEVMLLNDISSRPTAEYHSGADSERSAAAAGVRQCEIGGMSGSGVGNELPQAAQSVPGLRSGYWWTAPRSLRLPTRQGLPHPGLRRWRHNRLGPPVSRQRRSG